MANKVDDWRLFESNSDLLLVDDPEARNNGCRGCDSIIDKLLMQFFPTTTFGEHKKTRKQGNGEVLLQLLFVLYGQPANPDVAINLFAKKFRI